MKPAIKRFYLVSGVTAVILAASLLLLIFRPPENRSPEARLRRLTFHETPGADFSQSIDWNSTRKWAATFEINNPGREAIGLQFGQMLRDFVIVNRDGEQTAPFELFGFPLGGGRVYVGQGESKQLLRVAVPPGSKICRFRIVYWPMTARERWGIICTKWKLAMQYPSVVRWIAAHLPDKRRTLNAVFEVPLPSEPEVLADVDEGTIVFQGSSIVIREAAGGPH